MNEISSFQRTPTISIKEPSPQFRRKRAREAIDGSDLEEELSPDKEQKTEAEPAEAEPAESEPAEAEPAEAEPAEAEPKPKKPRRAKSDGAKQRASTKAKATLKPTPKPKSDGAKASKRKASPPNKACEAEAKARKKLNTA